MDAIVLSLSVGARKRTKHHSIVADYFPLLLLLFRLFLFIFFFSFYCICLVLVSSLITICSHSHCRGRRLPRVKETEMLTLALIHTHVPLNRLNTITANTKINETLHGQHESREIWQNYKIISATLCALANAGCVRYTICTAPDGATENEKKKREKRKRGRRQPHVDGDSKRIVQRIDCNNTINIVCDSIKTTGAEWASHKHQRCAERR